MSEAKGVEVKVLFVCMGNICRSPTAEGVFTQLVAREGLSDRIEIDSAGTHSYHIGKAPDSRSQVAARKRGIDLSHLRARRAEVVDFERFDYLLVMDRDNFSDLWAIAPEAYRDRLMLFLDFAPDAKESEVPDPYYGGDKGFEHVLDLVQQSSEGLLQHLRERYRF